MINCTNYAVSMLRCLMSNKMRHSSSYFWLEKEKRHSIHYYLRTQYSAFYTQAFALFCASRTILLFFHEWGRNGNNAFLWPWVRIVGVDASLGLPPLDPASRILRDCILSMMISQSSKLLLATGCIYRNRTMSMVIKGDFALAHRPCNWLQRQKMIFSPVWALPPGLSQFSFHLSPSSRDDISWGHGAQTQNHPKRHVRHRRNP